METTPKTTTIAVRVPWNMRERIEALGPMLEAPDLSTVARTLMEYGMHALVQGAPAPVEPEVSEVEAEAVLRHSLRTVFAMLDVLAETRPVGAIARAMELGPQSLKWAEATAERHGTSLADLLAAVGADAAAPETGGGES